jgi:hypothetical protein
MAKKKNQNRKHKFKYSEPASMGTSPNSRPAEQTNTIKQRVMTPAAVGPSRDFSYVTNDMRRIVIIASFLVFVELILWLILSNSAFSKSIYSLIKI